MKVSTLSSLLCVNLFGHGLSWDYVNELRLAGELRVVNEGLAHGEICIRML